MFIYQHCFIHPGKVNGFIVYLTLYTNKGKMIMSSAVEDHHTEAQSRD